MIEDFTLSRRQILKMSVIASGALILPQVNLAFAQPADKVPTSEQVMGPFYPIAKPADQDADLTVIQGKPGKAQGQAIYITGQVMNLKGQPVTGAQIEIWQANTFGRYTHPNDKNPAPLDPNFEGYGVFVTDQKGGYKFKTIKPAPYPAGGEGWVRPPHIHFQITTKTNRFVTQMYFAGEPLNEEDPLLAGASNQETLITKLTPPTKDFEPNTLIAAWDIVLPQT